MIFYHSLTRYYSMSNFIIKTQQTTTTAIVAIAAAATLSGCQTLPNMTQSSTMTSASMSSPFTAQMPTIDRQGRIAYVEEQGLGAAKVSTLYSIRPDGSDRQLIDQLTGYIYAPAWSADGQLLAYSKQASRQHPTIYIYDRGSQTRNLVVNAAGSNLSASFSPDGKNMLYSSTVGGNSDIYEMRLRDGKTRQLTTLSSTEVQPSYAPDGKSFVYTSDKIRAGRPRIYRYDFMTSKALPVSMTTGYAASPQLSMDGTRMAYLNGRKAAIMTLATGQVTNLAVTGFDEPARLSPSGQYAIYPVRAAPLNPQSGGRLVIHALAGNSSYTIDSQAGTTLRSPIWGR